MLIPFHDDNPTTRWPIVTIGLIVINILSLIYLFRMNDDQRSQVVARRGFVPKRLEQLTNPKQVVMVPVARRQVRRGRILVDQNQVIQLTANRPEILLSLITSLFLHGSVMHLVGNVWFLWLFGNNIEDRLGHVVFLLFYLMGGIVASICHWLMISPDRSVVPVIGASGAVAVILGAYAMTYPFARVRTLIFLVIFVTVVDLPALVVLGFWFLGQFIQVSMPNAVHSVAWWAHIGGFVAGLLLMPLLAAGTPEPGHDWEREANKEFDVFIDGSSSASQN